MAHRLAVAVIPARYASTRFPGKPLARDTGRPLIQHVYEQAAAAPGVEAVVVATDDDRIAEAVRSFGGPVAMTRGDHASGTDRVAEVAEGLDCDIVVNVQGDEPEIESQSIGDAVALLVRRIDCPMATLACPFCNIPGADPQDPNVVKVKITPDGTAVTFSRRNICSEPPHPLLHVGLYAYRRDFLLKFRDLPRTATEVEQRLEQMRAIEHGYPIAVALVERAAVGIDTPQDYEAFVRRWKQGACDP